MVQSHVCCPYTIPQSSGYYNPVRGFSTRGCAVVHSCIRAFVRPSAGSLYERLSEGARRSALRTQRNTSLRPRVEKRALRAEKRRSSGLEVSDLGLRISDFLSDSRDQNLLSGSGVSCPPFPVPLSGSGYGLPPRPSGFQRSDIPGTRFAEHGARQRWGSYFSGWRSPCHCQ